MKRKKSLLMISNSFGVNLNTFAHQLSQGCDTELDIGVLYIGGCPLITHAENIANDAKAYDYYENGKWIRNNVSIKEALAYRKWDYVSMQQASGASGMYDTFLPHADEIASFVRKQLPSAELIWHKTWQYESGSGHGAFPNYGSDPKKMKSAIDDAARKVCERLDIKTVIPSGDLVERYIDTYGEEVHADSFHLNELGCYLIGIGVCLLFSENKKMDFLFDPEGYASDHVNEINGFPNAQKREQARKIAEEFFK